MTTTQPDWRAELRAQRAASETIAEHRARQRCGCGHVRAAHTRADTSPRDDAGRVVEPGAGEVTSWPSGCAVMCCGCELFRGEHDR